MASPPSFLYFSGAINDSINLGGEDCHFCRLGDDYICNLLHHLMFLVQSHVGTSIHHAFHIISSVGKDVFSIHAGLKLYGAMKLYIGLLLNLCSVFH